MIRGIGRVPISGITRYGSRRRARNCALGRDDTIYDARMSRLKQSGSAAYFFAGSAGLASAGFASAGLAASAAGLSRRSILAASRSLLT